MKTARKNSLGIKGKFEDEAIIAGSGQIAISYCGKASVITKGGFAEAPFGEAVGLSYGSFALGSVATVMAPASVAVTRGTALKNGEASASKGSVAFGGAPGSQVKGDLGAVLVATDENYKLACALVDGRKIKPGIWYRASGGKLVKA